VECGGKRSATPRWIVNRLYKAVIKSAVVASLCRRTPKSSVNTSAPDDAALLYPETISKRRLPVNFNHDNLGLFSEELERVIPATKLLQLHDVRVSSDGFLFKGLNILPESFAFPANRAQWKRRSFIKFFVNNYGLRRSRTVEGDALWIVDDWSNGYFHWLTDVLSRLYVMRERLKDFVLLLPADYQSRDFVAASLKCFDVKTVEYIKPNEVLLCRKLSMPTHVAPSGHYNEEIIRGVRRLLLQNYGAAGDSRSSERIYISRGRAPKRRILNEDVVGRVLAEFGFETIYAEDLPFSRQVEICSRARYLVSNHGAGLTNMLFLPADSAVLELRLEGDAISNCYFTLASALNLKYFYQTCESGDSTDSHIANLVVDEEDLKRNVELLLQA
jgi:hypothetical protein